MKATFINIQDMLLLLSTADEVTIEVASFDDKRGSSGERYIYTGRMFRPSAIKNNASSISAPKEILTNPFHTKNRTINFRLKDGSIRTIKRILIEKINNKEVVL